MNILYCGDQGIADGVILSALSLTQQSRQPLHIYILTAGVQSRQRDCRPLPPDFATQLQRILNRDGSAHQVQIIDLTDIFAQELPVANLETRFTPCCMLRLYADTVPELPDKILYLDNDVLCRKDFSVFYHQDMTGYDLAGSLDYYGSWFFRKKPFQRDYLNSGVLLLNLAQIRRTGLFARCRQRCRNKKMFMPDQSAVNKLCSAKIILPRRYNEQRKLHDDTVFQHFTTSFRFFPYFHAVSVKPWNITGMHHTLRLHEYDDLLIQFQALKEEIMYAK